MVGKFRRYHVSYMGWISGFNDKDPAVLAGAGELNEVMGYRFVLRRFSWTANPAGEMRVRFTVRNDGSAPFYCKWPVAVALLDPATQEVRWQSDLKADLRAWLPGEDWDEAAEKWNLPPKEFEVDESVKLPEGLKKGNYVVALAILDADGGRLPSVRFATKNYWKGGWHPMGLTGIGSAPASTRLTGPFDDLIRDDSLHYEVPAALLSVKEPKVPAYTPVPIFEADANVELIDPMRMWSLEKRGSNTEMDHSQDGPQGKPAVTVRGAFGPDSCLHYSSAYQDKWPGGEYLLSFLMKGVGATKAKVHIADNWQPVTEEFPLESSKDWMKKEFRFTLPDDYKKFPRLRFILTSDQNAYFSVSDVRLRFANATGKPSRVAESVGGWGVQDSRLKPYGGLTAERGKISHGAFDQAWRAEIAQKPAQNWAVGFKLTVDRPIAEGEVLLLTFYARSAGSGSARLGLDFQKNSAPWTSSFGPTLDLSAEWKAQVFAFPAKIAYEAGDAKLSFLLGAQPQSVQLARVFLTNCGKGADAGALLKGGAR
jgi:hypothetical protein